MIFTNRKINESPAITIQNKKIERVTSIIKFLGVLMDEKLKWNHHTERIRQKLIRSKSSLLGQVPFMIVIY